MNVVTPLSATEHPEPVDSFIQNGRGVDAGNGWTWVVDGLSLFGKSAVMWVVMLLALFVISLLVALVPMGQFLLNLVSPLILAGLMVGCRAIEDGGTLEFDHVTGVFSDKPGRLFLLGVIYMVLSILLLLVFLAVIFAFAGSAILGAMANPDRAGDYVGAGVLIGILLALLVMMALVLPLAMASWFAVQLVYFHKVEPLDALKQSFNACLRNMLPFLIYGVVMSLFLVVALIPLGLGLLVWMPLLFTTMYTSYKDVFVEGQAA